MVRRWCQREYKGGDEQNILALHRLVFGAQVSVEGWAWQYRHNPAGQAVIVLAESDQGVVGQYSLVPRLTKIGNTACLGSLSLDTVVHPEYRGQGMFISLARQAYGLAAERGMHFVYGFPNENSHHGLVSRLDWLDIYDGIPLWVKPLNLQSIVRKRFVDNRLLAALGGKAGEIAMGVLCRPQRSTPACLIKEASCFDQRSDLLWNKASKDHKIAVVRDRAYLTWRYVEKPGNDYAIFTAEEGDTLLGYAVVTCMDKFGLRIGFVVDILAGPEREGVAGGLISAAAEYLQSRQMDVAGCLMLPGTRYARDLRRAGFVKASKRLLPQRMYLGVRSFNPGHTSESLADMDNWFVTWGDHDVV